ncbi:sugar kinase [Virgibacillus pantothenticus]|uniref:sugar kinase n=1 Tax=Virgibacillus pantothenticus TaxID=1473 RepID=UPI00098670FE|nr:sugar kinase [Virgibacillus pantothenticus]
MGKVVTLGEVLLRLSTSPGIRIPLAQSFHVQYGGAEANVAISLANYGHEVYLASKLPESNILSESVNRHLQSFGVSTRFIKEGSGRLGTYYLETGIGERGSNVIYDRAYSSFSMISKNEWEDEEMFKDADIFHVSGITPALSLYWRELTIELIKQARESGCKISFDINYRSKLWNQSEAGKTLRKILPFVDYCSAGKLDALYLLGISESSGKDEMSHYYRAIQREFSNIKVLYSTKREIISATANKLTGYLWNKGKLYSSTTHCMEPIVDRVGGGDAFSGGVLHGILEQMNPQKIIDFGTAASALKHTVEGDCNQFNAEEVIRFSSLGSGKITR